MFNLRPDIKLILASQSPRRRDLLAGAGLQFEVEPSAVPERPLPNERPEAMVARLAQEKGLAVAKRRPDAWIIAADTTVVIDGEILEKPADEKDAARMLSMIQGRVHEVWGGVSVRGPGGHSGGTYCSRVKIANLGPAEIERYIESGEPMDKAGAYAIQGIGAALVERVEGSYTNVVGLDLAATLGLLRKHGLLE